MTGSKGIYGGIAGWSECVHHWPIWCWVLRELVANPCDARENSKNKIFMKHSK